MLDVNPGLIAGCILEVDIMQFRINKKIYKMFVYPCGLIATITDGKQTREIKNWKKLTVKDFCSKVEKLFN